MDGLRQSRPDWRMTLVSSSALLQKQLYSGQYDVVLLDCAAQQGMKWAQHCQRVAKETAVSPPLVVLMSTHQSLEELAFTTIQGHVIYDKADLQVLPDLIDQEMQKKEQFTLNGDLFAEIAKLTTDAIVITEEDQIICYFNASAEVVFGYQSADVVGKPLTLLLPPRYHSVHQTHMKTFLQSGKQIQLMTDRQRVIGLSRDGQEFGAEVSIMKLEENGRIYFAAVIRDITEQQETAATLSQYIHRLEALRELEQAILAARSPEEIAQTALQHLQQLIPFNLASIIAFDPDQPGGILLAHFSGDIPFIHGDYRPIFSDGAAMQVLFDGQVRVVNNLFTLESPEPFERSLLEQGVSSYIMIPLTFSGEIVGLLNLAATAPRAFTETALELVDEAARPVAVAIHQARLLEKERTQRQLTETLQEVGRILTSTLDLEQVLSTILGQLSRVIAYDSATVMLMRGDDLALVARQDFGDKTLEITVPLSSLAHIREILETGVPVLISDTAVDSRWQKLPDTEYIRCWLGVPLVVKGIVIGLLNLDKAQPNYYTQHHAEIALSFAQQAAIAVENAQLYTRATLEIDERRQVEAALQIERAHLAEHVKERTAELSAANAQLVHAVRARDEFLASMSHELRTPLNAILGMAEVLQTGAYGTLSDKQQDLLRTIVHSGHHLLELINDILDIAKIEAGQLVLHLYPMPIAAMCRTCVELVERMAVKKQVQVKLDLSEEANVIWGDELRIQQILINLLNNAIKFTPSGGKVGLEVTVDPRKTTAYFTVWDTGIGMSLDDLRRLFSGPNGPKPFVQLDSGLSRQYEGTGLGLSLVYHLTELHGGSLVIKSEVGQGSRLTVALPCQSIVKQAESYEGKVIQTTKSKTILLAEDNELYARAISTYLLALGYRLVVAHTGLQAVQQARTTNPDLILLDLQMPEVGGMEALNLIHENTHLRDVPVIIWTALVMPGDQEYYLRQGATAFFPKPLNLPELAETIAALLLEERQSI